MATDFMSVCFPELRVEGVRQSLISADVCILLTYFHEFCVRLSDIHQWEAGIG